MGATEFFVKGRGRTITEAYERAVENAIDEYGNDPYNGTISTTSGFIDVTDEYKKSKKSMPEYINDKMDRAGKRDCFAICLEKPVENTNKTKSTVINKPYKGTRQWKLFYKVVDWRGEDYIFKSEKKEDAIKAARAYSEKNQATACIHIVKELVGSDAEVAKIEYKKATNEKPGVWQFFGSAAC